MSVSNDTPTFSLHHSPRISIMEIYRIVMMKIVKLPG